MKRIVSGVLCILFLLSMVGSIPTKVEAAKSGVTGSCEWSLDGTVLTISGSGEMGSYYPINFHTDAPWGHQITQIVIEEGVTNIGQYAFFGCSKLQSVSIPGSVKRIEKQAFRMTGLTAVTLPEGVLRIEDAAFESCIALQEVVLPDSLTYIGNWAFQSCSMTGVGFPVNLKHIGYAAFNYSDITDVWYKGNHADQAEITLDRFNLSLNTAAWHYEVTEADIDGRVSYFCPECDGYFLPNGMQVYPVGDFTKDNVVTNEDVIYLLWHSLFPEHYPVDSQADFFEDGQVTNEDVIYLLWHTLFPENYPLGGKKENQKEFKITITNHSGETIKNAAIVVGLHNTVGVDPEKNQMPFQIYDDVFSDAVGFRMFDEQGAELPYYVESESDCNYIVDKNIKSGQKTMAIFSDGKIAVYNANAKRMQISADNGLTWSNICEGITSRPYRILLPDSQDNLFVASADGYRLYKYTAADGYLSGTQVIDMEADGTKIASILAEDSDGNLYLGTYQTEWHCVIRKSTDHGNTWSIVFDTTQSQHVHNIFVNTKTSPNEIFIGLDGAAGASVKTYVSKDAGATWAEVDVPYYNNDNAFRYAGEDFYIGCGERNVLGGATLYKTTDYNDPGAYYPLFDNGQGVRDVTNVVEGSDDVLLAGGCVDDTVHTQQLFLSEDKGETWKTVLMWPDDSARFIAGEGLRTFSRLGDEIVAETYTGYPLRFVYGNGAKTTLVVVGVGDVPASGKTITLKTGYVNRHEDMETVLSSYEKIEGKVADIRIGDGYVVDTVSGKYVLTEDTQACAYQIKVGQTSQYKYLDDSAFRLNGSVNLGKLSRLDFTKGFTVSMLFRKEDGKDYLSDNKYHVIFQTGNTKLVLWRRSFILMDDTTNIFGTPERPRILHLDDAYLNSVNEDYVRVTLTFSDDELPHARIFTDNNWNLEYAVCTQYPIRESFSENDFIVGNSLTDARYDDIPNISRLEIYNRVLSCGEIFSLTNGCNLITDGSYFN